MGIVLHHLDLNNKAEKPLYSDKILNQLIRVKELIDSFPQKNTEEHDILGLAENIRAQYKKTCALLKISSSLPYGRGVSF